MSGIWPAAFDDIVQAQAMSALRTRQFVDQQALQSGSAAGIGTAVDGRGLGAGMIWIQNSGNSASGQIVVSPNAADWSGYSANSAIPPGTTAAQRISGYYGYWTYSATWISGGVRTATMTVTFQMGPGVP